MVQNQTSDSGQTKAYLQDNITKSGNNTQQKQYPYVKYTLHIFEKIFGRPKHKGQTTIYCVIGSDHTPYMGERFRSLAELLTTHFALAGK